MKNVTSKFSSLQPRGLNHSQSLNLILRKDGESGEMPEGPQEKGNRR